MKYTDIRTEKSERTQEASAFQDGIHASLRNMYYDGLSRGFSPEGTIYLIADELYGVHLTDIVKRKTEIIDRKRKEDAVSARREESADTEAEKRP